MDTPIRIDVAFDFQTDTPPGKDPDTRSPSLRKYHKQLWSKRLPGGAMFSLDDSGKNYLYHLSDLGEFFLASDAVIPTFWKEERIKPIASEIPDQMKAFYNLGYTIGGMMIFPGNRIGRAMTINGARGFHPRIKDRFDLTVECIRRHYGREPNPLAKVLDRYADFFALFEDFRGYVDFFLLQDLVNADCTAVNLFTPFEEFKPYPVPATADAYRDYMEAAVAFIEARNRRILAYVPAS
jgi:hypothetical protein